MADGAQAAALEARDARQALVEAHRPRAGAAVVAVSLNVPGPDRAPPGALDLFAWGLARLAATFPGARGVHQGRDGLGPFALIAVDDDPAGVKRGCVALETAAPSARLLDLDVYRADGQQVGRGALGLPPRPCLLCEAPAVECIRLGRHPLPAVLDRVRGLLAAP